MAEAVAADTLSRQRRSLQPGIGPMPGETGLDVMKRLPVADVPSMRGTSDLRYTQRFISIFLAIPEITVEGDYAEFGVYKGRCARFLTTFVPPGRTLHLFDSFEGLPEAWTGKWQKGHFDLGGKLPRLNPKKTAVYKGWFKDTIPEFEASLKKPLAFIHMDADLYSSTMDVFHALNNKIVAGTILLFDEYVMRKTDEEHRALVDWANTYNRKFEYLWRNDWIQVAVRVTV